MLPSPHKIFILQIRTFLKDALISAFHFLGSFTDLYDVFKVLSKKFRDGEPQKPTLQFKVMTSNSQWDWYYLWKTMRWHRGVVRNTKQFHSPGPALITLCHCCCRGEHEHSTKRGRWGISCWSSPTFLTCHSISPRGMSVRSETKATVSQPRSESSCYGLQQLPAVRAAFTLG